MKTFITTWEEIQANLEGDWLFNKWNFIFAVANTFV